MLVAAANHGASGAVQRRMPWCMLATWDRQFLLQWRIYEMHLGLRRHLLIPGQTLQTSVNVFVLCARTVHFGRSEP